MPACFVPDEGWIVCGSLACVGSVAPRYVIIHQIAGITFRTESDVVVPHLLEHPFTRFRVGDGEPDVRYRIRQFDPEALTLPPLDGGERERILRSVIFPQHWLDSPLLRSPEIRASVRVCLERPDLAHIGLRWNRALIRNYARNELDLFYPPGERESFAEPLILARFRNSLANFLPGFSAVMIHGAGVIRGGHAALFLAPDEGGKTTVARLSTGEPILNDDHVVLRQEGGVIMAHGTPFGPLTSGPQQARLGGIFYWRKRPVSS